MRCMIDEMKHDERIARFVLSLGIYLNTNGKYLMNFQHLPKFFKRKNPFGVGLSVTYS